jgi:hypothetical protein
LRALKLNKNESCPSEDVCLTDQEKGICARRARNSADETAEEVLARICHGGANGCKLFDTKPENTPIEFLELIDSIEYWRRRHAQGFPMPKLKKLGALFMAAYDGADEAHERVANESDEKEQTPTAPAIKPDSPFARAFPHLVKTG